MTAEVLWIVIVKSKARPDCHVVIVCLGSLSDSNLLGT